MRKVEIIEKYKSAVHERNILFILVLKDTNALIPSKSHHYFCQRYRSSITTDEIDE